MKNTKKKTLKAKKNKVQLHKKLKPKSIRRKTKVSKNVKSKKQPKKKLRKKIKYRISMEELYVIINKAQLGHKEISFCTTLEESFVVENTIKDAGLRYSKDIQKTQVKFIIFPSENPPDDVNLLDHIEFMDDEIPDLNQIFP